MDSSFSALPRVQPARPGGLALSSHRHVSQLLATNPSTHVSYRLCFSSQMLSDSASFWEVWWFVVRGRTTVCPDIWSNIMLRVLGMRLTFR